MKPHTAAPCWGRIARSGLLVLSGCAAAWLGQGQAQAQSVLTTTVCEIAAKPVEFDDRFVTIRAKILRNFEVFAIADPTDNMCGHIWLEIAGQANATTVSVRSASPQIVRTPVEPRKDRSFRKFLKLLQAELYPRNTGSLCIDCYRYEVTAVFTGRIDYAGENRGFGHLSSYPLRLLLQGVSNVEAQDLAAKYDVAQYSVRPIKSPSAEITGRVIAPNGKPIPDIEVTAQSTEVVPLYLSEETESTDENGRFRIRVSPGKYRVGVNVFYPPSPEFPYPPTYFPGVLDKDEAKVMVARNGDHIRVSIRVPKQLLVRKIPVRVEWPDGRAVSKANVWLAEVRDPKSVVGHAVSHTGEDGNFELEGLEGIDYLVNGSIYAMPRHTPHCAEPVRVCAADEVHARIVLRLTASGDHCR